MKFYITFGQTHTHPETEEVMKDYWVEIEANNHFEAYDIAKERFGEQYSMIYQEEGFDDVSRSYFPKGKYERKMTLDEMFEREVKGMI